MSSNKSWLLKQHDLPYSCYSVSSKRRVCTLGSLKNKHGHHVEGFAHILKSYRETIFILLDIVLISHRSKILLIFIYTCCLYFCLSLTTAFICIHFTYFYRLLALVANVHCYITTNTK